MSVSSKILLIMADVGMLSKDKQLKDGARYDYLSEEKVTAELHAACVNHKLVVCPISMTILESREDTTKNGGIYHNVRILAMYRVSDPEGEKDDYIEVAALGEGSDGGDKAVNKAMTAAYKYAMRQTFMISTGDDPDHKASEETTARTATRTAQPAAQPAAQANPPAARSNTGGGGGTATLRDLFKAMEEANLLEPDPTPERPDRNKPIGEFYGIMEKAGLPKAWSKMTGEQYAAAIAAVKGHAAKHTEDDAGDYPPDMEDPFA